MILFCYNRPEHTKKTLLALSKNIYAKETDVYIFVDGLRDALNAKEYCLQQSVVEAVSEIDGFKSKTVYVSEVNNGLAKSIIKGVTEIITKYKRCIVLEDDIVTGHYFLDYMNKALSLYENNSEVWHITGWHNPTMRENYSDSFFYPLMDCWGWATWSDRWKHFEKNPENLVNLMSRKDIKRFNVDGLVPDKWVQVLRNFSGVDNTWAIFWYAVIMQKKGLCLAPANSLVKNIGFDDTGVHCSSRENYVIYTDINHKITNFPSVFEIDSYYYNLLKQDYRKRFRKDRLKYAISKCIPKRVKKLLRKLRPVK